MQGIISTFQGEGIAPPNNSEINTTQKHKRKCMKTYTHAQTDRYIHAHTDTYHSLEIFRQYFIDKKFKAKYFR